MRATGLSEFIEPCGTIAMPASRSRRIASSVRPDKAMSSSQTAPPSIRPGGLIMRRMANAIVDLPDPDFAGQAKAFARAQREAYLVDSAHRAERMVIGDAEPLNAQNAAAHTDRRSRGLAISSRPTVRKNRPRNTITMTTSGAVHHHHQPLMIAALKLTQ